MLCSAEVIMRHGNRRYARTCLEEFSFEIHVGLFHRLKAQHTRGELKSVLNAMIRVRRFPIKIDDLVTPASY
jgi:hypothetical protein